jgi:ATP-dependent Lon protease
LGQVSGLHVARFDGAGASDSAFSGTPRRWSTGEPSFPLSTLLAARKADGLVILDEVEKGGTSAHNGNFANALLPFLESETARVYPDPYAGQVDVSRVSFIATANDELLLPKPLRDRFRLLRIPAPTAADLPAICRGVMADLVEESGSDPHWFSPLESDEIDAVGQLWSGGSVRRLRDIVARLIVRRADMPRH